MRPSAPEPVMPPLIELGAEPLMFAESLLTTQTLVGVLPGFGTGSGAPKKQPIEVQFLLLPVSAEVAGPRVATFAAQPVMAETAALWSGRS